jgi:PmbA protein
LTGDFGGEIKLAVYFDGENYKPFSGGTITSNINKVVNSMKFSNRLFKSDNYEGPGTVIFNNLKVSK